MLIISSLLQIPESKLTNNRSTEYIGLEDMFMEDDHLEVNSSVVTNDEIEHCAKPKEETKMNDAIVVEHCHEPDEETTMNETINSPYYLSNSCSDCSISEILFGDEDWLFATRKRNNDDENKNNTKEGDNENNNNNDDDDDDDDNINAQDDFISREDRMKSELASDWNFQYLHTNSHYNHSKNKKKEAERVSDDYSACLANEIKLGSFHYLHQNNNNDYAHYDANKFNESKDQNEDMKKDYTRMISHHGNVMSPPNYLLPGLRPQHPYAGLQHLQQGLEEWDGETVQLKYRPEEPKIVKLEEVQSDCEEWGEETVQLKYRSEEPPITKLEEYMTLSSGTTPSNRDIKEEKNGNREDRFSVKSTPEDDKETDNQKERNVANEHGAWSCLSPSRSCWFSGYAVTIDHKTNETNAKATFDKDDHKADVENPTEDYNEHGSSSDDESQIIIDNDKGINKLKTPKRKNGTSITSKSTNSTASSSSASFPSPLEKLRSMPSRADSEDDDDSDDDSISIGEKIQQVLMSSICCCTNSLPSSSSHMTKKQNTKEDWIGAEILVPRVMKIFNGGHCTIKKTTMTKGNEDKDNVTSDDSSSSSEEENTIVASHNNNLHQRKFYSSPRFNSPPRRRLRLQDPYDLPTSKPVSRPYVPLQRRRPQRRTTQLWQPSHSRRRVPRRSISSNKPFPTYLRTRSTFGTSSPPLPSIAEVSSASDCSC